MTKTLGTVGDNLELAEIQPFFAVELAFDTRTIDFDGESVEAGPLYFWTGLGDIEIEGNTYTGTDLISISEVKETADISAVGATLSLSGIPSTILALALQEPYQGRTATIKFGATAPPAISASDPSEEVAYEAAGQKPTLILDFCGGFYGTDTVADDEPTLVDLFVGDMDQMDIIEGPDTSTVSVKVESRLITLDKPNLRRYTSENQKALFSGDLAFDFVNDLQTKEILFGRAS